MPHLTSLTESGLICGHLTVPLLDAARVYGPCDVAAVASLLIDDVIVILVNLTCDILLVECEY